MEISLRQALLFSGLISFSVLASAISFELFYDLAPCELCIWQRWPHVIIIAIMLLGLSILNKTWILLLISLSAIVTGIIGFYHTGIEQGWWSGPLGCSNHFGSETDISNLTTLLLETPVVKCDEIVWSLFNISMAGWNSLVSFFIAIFSFFSWVHIKNKEKLYNIN